jgi:hypothetical protein
MAVYNENTCPALRKQGSFDFKKHVEVKTVMWIFSAHYDFIP